METTEKHEKFLSKKLPLYLNELKTTSAPLWGKMDVQQMLEHLCLPFLIATGKMSVSLTSPQDKIPVLKRILMSDKPLPKLFHNPILPEIPMPAAVSNLEESKKALRESVAFFLDYYKKNPHATALHNIYGELNYQEWLVMNIKHVRHHFAQFGVEVDATL